MHGTSVHGSERGILCLVWSLTSVLEGKSMVCNNVQTHLVRANKRKTNLGVKTETARHEHEAIGLDGLPVGEWH